ncbi:unnamed protein product [Brachionus calyciflorus]|uniref:Uncharacterized protein n=1 Tax=Brachionus calyciflorus TaxID=104777 RepID=A0A814B1J5_9BILA|nr:unnamed protein product [Brachionus calyciflorus]
MVNNPKENKNKDEKPKEVEIKKEENFILDKLSIVTDNLETYQGRDTVITLLHYIALIIADLCTYFKWGRKKKYGDRFVNMFVQLSNCRVMLRLFDDFNAIREYYRFYKDEKLKKSMHPYVKWVTTINLFFWIMYNPCEHLGWLGELKIINVDDQLWYFWTNVAWAGGLFTSVILNLNVVYLFYNQVQTKAQREDDKNYDSSKVISKSQMNQAVLIAFRDFLDWCIAIHFMPEGFLWSAQLYHYQVGLIGVVSSLCRVHTYVINRQE